MNFDSLQAIYDEFGIPPDKDLRSELQRRRATLHPDKNGGVPVGAESTQQFQRLSEAIEYLDSLPQALQRIDPQIRAIESGLVALQSAVDSFKTNQSVPADSGRSITADLAHRYRGRLIGSGAFAAICGGILAFSRELPANVVFAPVARNGAARWGLFLSFLIAGGAFIVSWLEECRIDQRAKWLLTDEGLRTLLRQCIHEPSKSGLNTEITKWLLVKEIYYLDYPWHKFALFRLIKRTIFSSQLPSDLSELIAEIHVNTLLAREIVRRNGTKGIDPLFIIETERAEEIANEH